MGKYVLIWITKGKATLYYVRWFCTDLPPLSSLIIFDTVPPFVYLSTYIYQKTCFLAQFQARWYRTAVLVGGLIKLQKRRKPHEHI